MFGIATPVDWLLAVLLIILEVTSSMLLYRQFNRGESVLDAAFRLVASSLRSRLMAHLEPFPNADLLPAIPEPIHEQQLAKVPFPSTGLLSRSRIIPEKAPLGLKIGFPLDHVRPFPSWADPTTASYEVKRDSTVIAKYLKCCLPVVTDAHARLAYSRS